MNGEILMFWYENGKLNAILVSHEKRMLHSYPHVTVKVNRTEREKLSDIKILFFSPAHFHKFNLQEPSNRQNAAKRPANY